MADLATIHSWFEEHQKRVFSDFFTFLRFPSISTDVAYKEEVKKTAEWLRDYLVQMGLTSELWETSVHPVVFAEYRSNRADAPTVLIYHHYDVQPVDPINLWISPPFEPQIREGFIYARGASDNKGQCFASITAIRSLLASGKDLGVNIKLFIEGEEECGSVGSNGILSKKKKELQADHLLIVDMGLIAPKVPCISLGLRGIVALEVECSNSKKDLHSGIMGGVVLNPNRALASLLSQLWDDLGRVTVPGFYEDVSMPTEEEKSLYLQDFDLSKLQREFGIKALQKEEPYSFWESNVLRPTVEINGISGGYTGVGFKTVIPAKAIAKISCRLVPNQEPEKIGALLADFLKKRAPAGIEVSVRVDHGTFPVRTTTAVPIAKICSTAYEEVFEKKCENILCAATVPVYPLKEASGADVAMIGVSLDSDDIHSPNEHFGVDQFRDGVLTMGRILTKLGMG